MDSYNHKEYKEPKDFVDDEVCYALYRIPRGRVANCSFESGRGTKCKVHVKNVEK